MEAHCTLLFLQKLQWVNHLHNWILGTPETLMGSVCAPDLDLMGEKQSQCLPHQLLEDGWTSKRSQEREPEPQLRAGRAAGNSSHCCRDTPNYTTTPWSWSQPHLRMFTACQGPNFWRLSLFHRITIWKSSKILDSSCFGWDSVNFLPSSWQSG